MEVDLYGELLIEATRLGNRLFRNNIGMAKYTSDSGHVYTVPYGVGGKGGGDLIGWTVVGQWNPGATNYSAKAVFTAIEVKNPDEVIRKKRSAKEREREKQQERFLQAVRDAGGIAGIVQSVDDYHKLIGHGIVPPL